MNIEKHIKPSDHCKSTYPKGWTPTPTSRQFNMWARYIARLNGKNVERYFV